MNKNWVKTITKCLPNLYVLVVNDVETGFITKPIDDKYSKNMWRVFQGKGESCQFLGHASTKKQAKQMVEKAVIGY